MLCWPLVGVNCPAISTALLAAPSAPAATVFAPRSMAFPALL